MKDSTVTMPTPDGEAQAIRRERHTSDGGYKYWTIGYPTTGYDFEGTVAEVKQEMKNKIKEIYPNG